MKTMAGAIWAAASKTALHHTVAALEALEVYMYWQGHNSVSQIVSHISWDARLARKHVNTPECLLTVTAPLGQYGAGADD